MTLQKKIFGNNTRLKTRASTPQFFDLSKNHDRRAIKKLLAQHKDMEICDDYREQLIELFGIKNPPAVFAKSFQRDLAKYLQVAEATMPLWQQGKWVFFPWSLCLVHILNNKEFQLVRTARNKNLITEAEQEKFYNAVVGIAGLSIGNSAALAIVLQGGAHRIKLADFDRLALSNLNRIRAGIHNLGLTKVEITARQIYELNPYAQVTIFPEGLTEKNIEKFFHGPPALDIMVDELDNLSIKHLIRQYAQKKRVPVVMAADNGDNGVVDIERYDLNKKTPFFHGRIGKTGYQALAKLDKFGTGRLITKHVGLQNVTPRMQFSLSEMGKTIVSWPQLGGAALLNGSVVAYCVRKIAIGQPLEKNRAIISLDEKLDTTYYKKRQISSRKKSAAAFKKIFNL